jgi:hypothetical protein
MRLLWLTVLGTMTSSLGVRADALDRMTAEKLAAVRASVAEWAKKRQEVARPGPWKEYRANLHVHSAFSHDSRGKIEDIVASAKKAGTQVLMFTEHPAAHYDFVKDGHQGMRDGVLMVAGAEEAGLLAYPLAPVPKATGTLEMAALVKRTGGLNFLAHLEERMDVESPDLTGVEIYNIHALFKEQKRLVSQMKNPIWLANAAKMINQYPQEAYSTLHDYPANYLKRFDALCQKRPHTGVSANDAHQNIGLVLRLKENNKVQVEDALGEKLLEIDRLLAGAVAKIPADAKPGDVVLRLQLDRYENALRHAATHLLMEGQTREQVWEALEKGRAFVGFDWMADSTGFQLEVQEGDKRHAMGSRLKLEPGMRLAGKAPLAGEWKIARNGMVVQEGTGRAMEMELKEPGVYRAEVWLEIAGEKRVWILSNPIYVR